MDARSSEGVKLPGGRVIARGLQVFILFSIIGFGVGFWWKAPAHPADLLGHLNWFCALLLLPLLIIDYVMGGLRYRVLLNGKTLPHVSLWNCMRSNWANIFMGATTPFQTGGGAAQLYILWRCGVRVSEGILASLVNFAGTLIFFLTSSIVALILLPADLFGPHLTALINSGFAIVITVAVLVLVVLFFPRAALWCMRMLAGKVFAKSKALAAIGNRVVTKLEGEVDRFDGALGITIKRGKVVLLLIVLLTMVLFFNKFTIGYVIVRALGHDVPYGTFLGLQCIQLVLIYFAPTPGASGVAELSSVWLMDKVLTAELLLTYAVLWRLFTTILGAIIGGFVLFFDLRSIDSRVRVSPEHGSGQCSINGHESRTATMNP